MLATHPDAEAAVIGVDAPAVRPAAGGLVVPGPVFRPPRFPAVSMSGRQPSANYKVLRYRPRRAATRHYRKTSTRAVITGRQLMRFGGWHARDR